VNITSPESRVDCDEVQNRMLRIRRHPQPVKLLPRTVDIGGRRINLRCSGSGAPTVVLVSGLASWSIVWYKNQPGIAKRTRVCSFDRASYGFSDPAPRPQILPDVPEDLHATLEAARVPGLYVLVGHSLGGIEPGTQDPAEPRVRVSGGARRAIEHQVQSLHAPLPGDTPAALRQVWPKWFYPRSLHYDGVAVVLAGDSSA
jgi:hypothetical protein